MCVFPDKPLSWMSGTSQSACTRRIRLPGYLFREVALAAGGGADGNRALKGTLGATNGGIRHWQAHGLRIPCKLVGMENRVTRRAWLVGAAAVQIGRAATAADPLEWSLR